MYEADMGIHPTPQPHSSTDLWLVTHSSGRGTGRPGPGTGAGSRAVISAVPASAECPPAVPIEGHVQVRPERTIPTPPGWKQARAHRWESIPNTGERHRSSATCQHTAVTGTGWSRGSQRPGTPACAAPNRTKGAGASFEVRTPGALGRERWLEGHFWRRSSGSALFVNPGCVRCSFATCAMMHALVSIHGLGFNERLTSRDPTAPVRVRVKAPPKGPHPNPQNL